MDSSRRGHKREDSGSSNGTHRADSQTSHRTQSTAPTDYGSSHNSMSETTNDHTKGNALATRPTVYFDGSIYASNESLPALSDEKGEEGFPFPPGAVEYGGSNDSSNWESELYDDDAPANDKYELNPQSEPLPSVPDVRPATSQDFSELFPSSRELKIRHDDSTMDGNMNLSIQTPVTTSCGYSRSIVLFHLRMYDLKSRDFSLRRYCRESGREIAHCRRKSSKSSSANSRPGFQRSLSNALAAFRSKSELKSNNPSNLKRHDSGYDSMHSDNEADEAVERPSSSQSNKAPAANASDVLALEFSNYAHLDLRRKGFKTDKRYDFDYWGASYSWKKTTQRLGKDTKEVSYHLIRRSDSHVVARIFPEPLSESEATMETEKGGWIPPCSMRITDQKVMSKGQKDLADVFVATGIIALVDDCIRRHFQRNETRQLIIPLSKLANLRSNKNNVSLQAPVEDTLHHTKPPAIEV